MNRCSACHRPSVICVCDRVTPLPTHTRVLLLQHPQEPDVALGTAPLVLGSLPGAQLRVGLSWGSFEDALGEAADPRRWAILYPASLPRPLTDAEARMPSLFLDPKGAPLQPLAGGHTVDGIVLLDGTWSQAKALWWRNPWMLKLNRLLLFPSEAPLYGKLRREPRKGAVSTLEATGHALVANGEAVEVKQQLFRVMRTLCQRARDNLDAIQWTVGR